MKKITFNFNDQEKSFIKLCAVALLLGVWLIAIGQTVGAFSNFVEKLM